MKIGIIVHSKTGQTLRFAQLIKIKLSAMGHEVDLTELTTDIPVNGGSARRPMNFKITNLPDVSSYDALCIGGPVWAFGPSPVIYKALVQISGIKGKRVLPFVTMGFPFEGMGGNGAIKHMSQAIRLKEAKAIPGIIIPKMFRNQAALMQIAVEDIGTIFK